MTFMLDEFDPNKVQPRKGPDMQPQGFLPSWMAASSQMMRDTNASFLLQREVNREALNTSEPAARKLGIDELNRRYEADYGGYDHINPAPKTVDDFYAMHPDNITNELVLKAARDASTADPAGWADMDLSQEGIDARVTERLRTEDADDTTIMSMSNYPVLASLAGGITGAMADVRNVPFLLMGGGGGSLLRTLGQEAFLGGLGEAVTLPSQYEMAKVLDKPDPNPISQIALGAVGGAVISSAAHALGRGLAYFKGRMELQAAKGESPVFKQAAVQAAESALINGDDPLAAVQKVMRSAPPMPEQSLPSMTQSADFKKWSAGTKVADPEGKPVQVFHGTFESFSEFDPTKGGSESGAKDAEGVMFFTDDPEVAASYVHDDPYGSNAVERLLAKVTGGRAEKAVEKIKSVVGAKSAYIGGGNIRPTYLSIKDPYEFDFGGLEYDEKTFTDIISKAKKDGRDGVIIRNVDDAAIEGKQNATVYVAFNKDQVRSTFDPRNREPLIPEAPPAIEQSTLPPMPGDAPRSAAEVAAIGNRALEDAQGLDEVLQSAKAADDKRAKPLIGYLSRGHAVSKKAAAAGKTGGTSLQIDPDGTLGRELKAAGITPRSAPGLFKKGGRSDLDNLTASEMEDSFPGIIDATGTARDATYLDRQGVIDLIVRDANGDASWLRSRADVAAAQAQVDLNQRVADGDISSPAQDFSSGRADPAGFFVSLDHYFFDDSNAQFAIERDVEAFMAERWPTTTFTSAERKEIIDQLTTHGGDVEFLVDRVLERDLDYADIPPKEAYSHADLSDPAYQRFLDEAAASRVSEAGGGGSGGPKQDSGAARGGSAGEVGADGQSRIPGTDTVDTGQAQRDRATIAARQQQSKLGRLDQSRVEDQPDGLFGGAQSDLFSDPLAKEARVIQDAVAADFRDQVAVDDFRVDMSDGKGERSASSLLDELDGDDEFQAILDACGMGK